IGHRPRPDQLALRGDTAAPNRSRVRRRDLMRFEPVLHSFERDAQPTGDHVGAEAAGAHLPQPIRILQWTNAVDGKPDVTAPGSNPVRRKIEVRRLAQRRPSLRGPKPVLSGRRNRLAVSGRNAVDRLVAGETDVGYV